MNISRPWQLAVALAEVAQGLICLLTLTLWRPAWAASLRLKGLVSMAAKWDHVPIDQERVR